MYVCWPVLWGWRRVVVCEWNKVAFVGCISMFECRIGGANACFRGCSCTFACVLWCWIGAAQVSPHVSFGGGCTW